MCHMGMRFNIAPKEDTRDDGFYHFSARLRAPKGASGKQQARIGANACIDVRGCIDVCGVWGVGSTVQAQWLYRGQDSQFRFVWPAPYVIVRMITQHFHGNVPEPTDG